MAKALGIIETKGLVGSIEAADVMLKTAAVRLVKIEKVSALLVAVFVEGDVSAVTAAVEAGKIAASNVGDFYASHVIPRPDEGIKDFVNFKTTSILTGTSKANTSEKNKGQTPEEVTKTNITIPLDEMETTSEGKKEVASKDKQEVASKDKMKITSKDKQEVASKDKKG